MAGTCAPPSDLASVSAFLSDLLSPSTDSPSVAWDGSRSGSGPMDPAPRGGGQLDTRKGLTFRGPREDSDGRGLGGPAAPAVLSPGEKWKFEDWLGLSGPWLPPRSLPPTLRRRLHRLPVGPKFSLYGDRGPVKIPGARVERKGPLLL